MHPPPPQPHLLILIPHHKPSRRPTNTKSPPLPIRSLFQTRRARASSAARPPAEVGDLVGDGADDVEEHVVDEEEGPGADGHDAEEELFGEKEGGWLARMFWDGCSGEVGGGLTKKRMIHVSRTVRLAGRMENHDMEGGGVEVRWKGGGQVQRRCCGVYRMILVESWEVPVVYFQQAVEVLDSWSLIVDVN